MGPLRWALCLAGLVSCVRGYAPNSLLAEGAPSRALRLGCLDVVMTTAATSRSASEGEDLVVHFAFGNRCDYAVPVDFGALTVVGLYGSERVVLTVSDPRHEVHRAILQGRGEGRETFEFVAGDTRPELPSAVCVTLDGLTDAPRDAEPVTRCLALTPPVNRPSPGEDT